MRLGHRLGIGLGCRQIEREYPPRKGGEYLTLQLLDQTVAATPGGQPCHAKAQLGHRNHGQKQGLGGLRIEPGDHTRIGCGAQRLGNHIGVEQDHSRSTALGAEVSR